MAILSTYVYISDYVEQILCSKRASYPQLYTHKTQQHQSQSWQAGLSIWHIQAGRSVGPYYTKLIGTYHMICVNVV